MDKGSRITLVGSIVVAILFIVGAALFVAPFARTLRGRGSVGCASNLRSLWQSQFNYAAQYGRPDGRMPEATGSDFFLALQRTPKPLIDRYEPFICPASGDEPGPGRCSYRGPAFRIRTMAPEDPFAADKEGNHGKGQGGNVLTGTGDVHEVGETDPAWIRARSTTKE